MTGLAAVLHQSALAFEVVKYVGVACLIWMAIASLREDGELQVKAGPTRPARAVLIEGGTINLLNPKLSIFFMAFLPQFIDAADPAPARQMNLLSLVFVAMTCAVFVAAQMRNRMLSRPRVMAWLRRGFAAAFLALGAKLALTER